MLAKMISADGEFCLLLTFTNSLSPLIWTDRTMYLSWIQTVLHSDSVPEFFFAEKVELADENKGKKIT